MKHTFERYCKDYKNIENYDKAKADNFKGWDCHHRLETHNSDGDRRLVDITQKELIALGMYYHRPAEELIFLPRSEHDVYRKGKRHTEETKKKMSEAQKGKKRSAEARRKMSESAKGKKMSDETRRRMVEAMKGKRAGEKNPMYGKLHTKETRKKMSDSWDYDKHFSAETRKKMGASRKGRHWFNNGKESKFCFECPPGFTPGRLRINKSLQEYLDRTGQTVSRKTFEKYKDKKKSFVGWEILIR